MRRTLLVILFALSPAVVSADELRFEKIIGSGGYVNYMAEMTCLMLKQRAGTTPEELEKMRNTARALAREIEPKFGIDRLSESEKSRMVAYFSQQHNMQAMVSHRAREISPSCDSALPPRLAEIMSRDQFVSYMATLFCLRKTRPAQFLVPNYDRFNGLSDHDKARIADNYTLTPAVYGDIRERTKLLDAQCRHPDE